ncbi:MAG: hypothetical protein ABI643_02500 [Candidatus Doudnabacteria bacterium]
MNEDKLAQELETYKRLAQQDKKIDVAALAIMAMQSGKADQLTDKQKKWAYIISVAVPPVGIFFAVKFYFSGKEDGQEAALICVALTAISILLFVILATVIFSSSGVSLNQVQQIKPSDIQQLIQ